MAFAIKIGDAWVEVVGGNVELPDRTVSAAWVEGLEPEDRQALGFVEIEASQAPALPPGLSAAPGLETVDGQPRRTWSSDHISDAALAAAQIAGVNRERDRRIEGGFPFAGGICQSRLTDQQNISTLGVQAQFALLGGAEAGDLRWHGGPDDFAWILADNTTVALDAAGMVGLFQTGVGFKSALTFAARAKKDWLLDPARTREELIAFDVTSAWPV